jgi:hypothetical protein
MAEGFPLGRRSDAEHRVKGEPLLGARLFFGYGHQYLVTPISEC